MEWTRGRVCRQPCLTALLTGTERSNAPVLQNGECVPLMRSIWSPQGVYACVRVPACVCVFVCVCLCLCVHHLCIFLCLCVSVHIQHVLNISFQRAVWIIREIRIRKIRVSLAHYVQKSSFNESNIVLYSRLSKSGSTSLYNGSVTHDNIYCCY